MSKIRVGDSVEHSGLTYTDLVVQSIEDDNTHILYSKEMSLHGDGHNGRSTNHSYEGNGDSLGHYRAGLAFLTLKESSKSSSVSHKFKVGDYIKPKSGVNHHNYTFQILVYGSFCQCYSKELDDAGKGHDGCKHINGRSTGHWNFHKSDIELVSDPELENKPFQIGDTVKVVKHSHLGMEFKVLHVSESNIVGFSQELCDEEIGHTGSSKGNGQRYGHWNFDHDELKIIKSVNSIHEIHRSNPEGCPGGIESKIHSKPIQIASGCRPIGSGTAACGIGIKVGRGVVYNNKLQPHPSC